MGWVEQKMKLYKAFLNLFLKVQKSSKMNQNLAKKSLWFNPSKLKNPKIFENLMHHYTTYIGSVYIGKNYISLEKIREIWNKSISQFFLINKISLINEWRLEHKMWSFLYRFHLDIVCTGCPTWICGFLHFCLIFFSQIRHDNFANILIFMPTNNNQEYDKFPSSSKNMTTIIILFYFCNNP